MNDEPVQVEAHKEKKQGGDPFGAIFWGLVLIWLGISFLLKLSNWFYYFLIGLGCVFVIDGILRQLWSTYKKPVLGKFLTGVILIVVGLALNHRVFTWWPVVPIIVGVGIIIAGVMKIRESAET